ncbi:MAG: 16S rRNA (guanine(527)-N(7))-methyltransferase RsmG [Clostridia bacterium]|nr:16S rRNA (guanine(527)-N(7))-methyltransferase RsmG [Clostridia bacterium]
MEFEVFKSYFKEELDKNNLNVEVDFEKFYIYMKELLDWNEKINLTAIKDEKEFVVKHFVDSLTIANLVSDNCKVIDVGTGAGFPGIPLKIVKNSIEITLVDSVNKKVMVLQDVINKLGLEKIDAIHTRAEDIAHKTEYRESFDIATSRAVSNLTTLVEYLLPFVKVGGKVLCMKGPNCDIEIEDAKKAIATFGGKIVDKVSLNIDNELERHIVVIEKVANTPKKYPRGQGLPLKKPLN